MTKGTFFFTLRDDLLSVLALVERREALAYRLVGVYDDPAVPVFGTAAELPGLGATTAESRNDGASYLVMPAGRELKLRAVDRDAGRVYFFNQWDNPDSIYLTPSGQHVSGAIVSGECVTASEADESCRLYNAIRRALRSRCMRCGESCYVGPLAHRAAVEGARLADDINSPVSSDLKAPKRWRSSRA